MIIDGGKGQLSAVMEVEEELAVEIPTVGLAKQMGEKGSVAILAGNQNAPNLRKRVDGVKEAAKKYPNMKIVETFYHVETPQDVYDRSVPSWFVGLTINALLGGAALFWAWRRTEVPARRLPSRGEAEQNSQPSRRRLRRARG